MAVIFLPKTIAFNGNSVAGSGTVIQATYTVPVNRRAILDHTYLQVNANGNAVNTTFSAIQCNIGGTLIQVLRLHGSGGAFTQSNAIQSLIDLSAGDNVQLLTLNFGAANVGHFLSCVIREYQE